MPFDLVLTNPGSKGDNGSRHPDFLAKHPAGTIPCLEERETGFTLGEAHAIMTYLAQEPTAGKTSIRVHPQAQARIDAYLHYHHRNLREASVGFGGAVDSQRSEHPGCRYNKAARRTLERGADCVIEQSSAGRVTDICAATR
jgi:glutathione S-transferase